MLKRFNKLVSEVFDPNSALNERLITAAEVVTPSSAGRRWSTKPSHVDVSGDPPICSRCRTMITEPRELGKEYTHSWRFIRMKTAAELGCCLCYLFYNMSWTPSSFGHAVTEQIQQISNQPGWIIGELGSRPDEILYRFQDKDEGSDDENYWCFSLTMRGRSSVTGDNWQKKLLLLPEIDGEDLIAASFRTTTNHETASSMAVVWLTACETSHHSCSNTSTNIPLWRPTRLIHITNISSTECPEINLCLAADVPPARYITLSHCWGGMDFFKLLTENINQMFVQIPWERLIPTFQDTIDMAHRLGIEYIWIDSLCIIQDSHSDWERESATMGNVYKNSWCNISATGFPNGEKGLFAQRDVSMLRPNKFPFNLQDDKARKATHEGKYYVIEDFLRADIAEAPLNERAWVFQERVLSPRILHFGSRQILWECRELNACEVFPEGVPEVLDQGFKAKLSFPERRKDIELGEDEKDEMLILWGRFVAGYNGGRLTKPEDKFVAIAGIAKEMQKLLAVPFIAGFWRRRLLQQLLWRTDNPEEQKTRTQRSQKFQAPSWSWAALNGPVKCWEDMEVDPLATVEDIQVDRANDSQFGQLKGGYLRIRGVLSRATITSGWAGRLTVVVVDDYVELGLRSTKGKDLLICPTVYPDVYGTAGFLLAAAEIYTLSSALGSKDFWLLPLVKGEDFVAGLALTRDGQKGRYRRLGMFKLLDGVNDDDTEFADLLTHVPWLELDDFEVRYNQREVVLTII